MSDEIKVYVNDEVTGSIPVDGSRREIFGVVLLLFSCATLAQLVEHHFRKVGVPGPIPGGGSNFRM